MSERPVTAPHEPGRSRPAGPPEGFDYLTHYQLDGEVFDYETDGLTFPADERRRMQSVVRLTRARPGERVLDVGSGSGWLAKTLARRGCRVVALDLSQRNLRRILEDGSGVRTVFGETARPPLASGAFDKVFAIEVVEHLTDPEEALRQMQRVLRPGGTLLVCVPYRERIEYNLCVHCNRPTPKSAHLHSFTEESLRRLLESAGLAPKTPRLFLNKGISLLRLNAPLAWLPLWAWGLVDGLANRVTGKARYIGFLAEKKAG